MKTLLLRLLSPLLAAAFVAGAAAAAPERFNGELARFVAALPR